MCVGRAGLPHLPLVVCISYSPLSLFLSLTLSLSFSSSLSISMWVGQPPLWMVVLACCSGTGVSRYLLPVCHQKIGNHQRSYEMIWGWGIGSRHGGPSGLGSGSYIYIYIYRWLGGESKPGNRLKLSCRACERACARSGSPGDISAESPSGSFPFSLWSLDSFP